MKTLVRLAIAMVFAITAVPLAAPRQAAPAPPVKNGAALERELPKPNYELASRWTSAKVGKLVFSTSVTPHWLEFSDRFWYSYETPAGMKWWIVDPLKKSKVPMFDHAKMASQLTRMLRTPYDAQHLPITTVKFIKNDTAIQFSVTLPRESKVEDETGQELDGMTLTDQEQEQQQGGRGGGRGGRGGGQQTAGSRPWRPRRSGRGEHQAVVARVRPRDRHADARREVRTRAHDAQLGVGLARQADGHLRARPQHVHDGREELRARAEEGRRSRDPGSAAHDRRRKGLQLRRRHRARRSAAGRPAGQ